jgi:hypothetical protein
MGDEKPAREAASPSCQGKPQLLHQLVDHIADAMREHLLQGAWVCLVL